MASPLSKSLNQSIHRSTDARHCSPDQEPPPILSSAARHPFPRFQAGHGDIPPTSIERTEEPAHLDLVRPPAATDARQPAPSIAHGKKHDEQRPLTIIKALPIAVKRPLDSYTRVHQLFISEPLWDMLFEDRFSYPNGENLANAPRTSQYVLTIEAKMDGQAVRYTECQASKSY